MSITKVAKKTGKTIMNVVSTTEDIFELLIYLLKTMMKMFPSLGRLILLVAKTSALISRDVSTLFPYIGNLSLLMPFIIIMALANYVGNIISDDQEKNKTLDNLFLFRNKIIS